MCIAGARWVQENILDEYPDANIEVTAIWFEMLLGDSRERWDPEVLPDSRVTHLWDPDQEIGRWFYEHQQLIGFNFVSGFIVWDAFLLFGPEATWDEVPAPLVSFGYTVFGSSESLRASFKEVLADLASTSARGISPSATTTA